MGSKRILVIAGSDSSGGAGLEADQKVIAAHGCYAMTATTALTAQNTQGVRDIHVIPTQFVKKQIDACFEDIGVDVIKTGMLASAHTVVMVANTLKDYTKPGLVSVIDPVMVATSGAQLLPLDAVKSLREHLLPITTVLTPNLPEALLLLQDAGLHYPAIRNVEDLRAIASAVRKLGPKYVLLKGGHMPLTKARLAPQDEAGRDEAKVVVNVLCGEDFTLVFEAGYIESSDTHGTGCSLASAIASNIACGMSMQKAVKAACEYISVAIRTAPGFGIGNGPINHFHSSYKLPFSSGYFVEYLLGREDVVEPWKQYTEHEFISRLADGSLPLKAFQLYLVQDYLFLVQFARANALAAYKARTINDIAMSAALVNHIHKEMSLHLDYCVEFGLSKAEVEKHEESQSCTAYTRYVLDVGQSSDWLALQVAMAPCLLGYGEIANRLLANPSTKREGNRYWKWIETYAAEDYSQAMATGRGLLEKYAAEQSPSRIEELVQIFIHATKMETGFWDMKPGELHQDTTPCGIGLRI